MLWSNQIEHHRQLEQLSSNEFLNGFFHSVLKLADLEKNENKYNSFDELYQSYNEYKTYIENKNYAYMVLLGLVKYQSNQIANIHNNLNKYFKTPEENFLIPIDVEGLYLVHIDSQKKKDIK